MKYKVAIGKEFEISNVEIEEKGEVDLTQAQTELKKAEKELGETKNRNIVTWFLLCMIVAFLMGAAVLGFYDGNFEKLQSVYNVVAIPMSAMLAYYFGENNGMRKDKR
jgi:uncharacterized membrane protein